jgi:hypothetical protein
MASETLRRPLGIASVRTGHVVVSTAVRMRVYSAIFGFDGTPGDAEAAAAHW